MKTTSLLGVLSLLTSLYATSTTTFAHGDPAADIVNHRLHGIDLPEQQKIPIIGLTEPRFGETDEVSKSFAAKMDCDDPNLVANAASSVSSLADYIAGLPMVECTFPLFSINASLAQVIYTPANVTGLANRLEQEAANYNASGSAVANLVLYLRAGYFNVAGRNIIPDFGAAAKNANVAAIQALLNNPMLQVNNADEPTTFAETLTLITNAEVESQFLIQMRNLVVQYTNSGSNPNAVDPVIQNETVRRGFTGVLTVFFYAHGRPDNAALKNPIYPQALYAFFQNNRTDLETAGDEFQATDTLRETLRFLRHTETYSTVKPMVQTVLDNNNFTIADQAPYWIEAANAVQFYDNNNCADYGVCDAKGQVETFVLDDRYDCSDSVRIIAQDINQAQADDSCALIALEDDLFHAGLNTGRVPVSDDFNVTLEVVVFDDYDNYDLYASYLYNVSTDNGGIYLEGDPSDADNQARFLAHEASWLRPEFAVWNLEHEFVHYLDGRYNLKGDFGDSIQEKTVWWIEGLAEYYSLQNNNQAAIDIGQNKTYPLSEIFQNTYQVTPFLERVYRWGYLAVRFMFENHRGDVDTILGHFRAGDYAAYAAFMQSIGTSYDAEFNAWLDIVSTEGPFAGGGNGGGGGNDGQLTSGIPVTVTGQQGDEIQFFIDVPADSENLTVEISGGTGDADLYVRFDQEPTLNQWDYRPWINGNNETVSVDNPSAGRWYIMIQGYNSFDHVQLQATVTEQSEPPPPPPPAECPADTLLMSNGCIRTLSSSTVSWHAIWMPPGASNLVFSTSGGSGNADLYIRFGSWPNATTFDLSSANPGNTETISIPSPNTGNYYYIMVDAEPSFSNVQLTVTFND